MPTSVELFAGGGGMALGMQQAGFEHEQLVEISPAACEVLRENARRDPRLWKKENIREIDAREWMKEIQDLGLKDIDLVAGGPPCQPFSASGKRAGVNDDRDMFPAAIEAVRRLQPKMFAFENVPGLLRESFKPYYDYITDYLARPGICPKDDEPWEDHHSRVRASTVAELRYNVFRQEMNAADFGVPQVRKRVFLIGFRADVLDQDDWEPVPTTHSKESLLRAQWIDGDYWSDHAITAPSSMPDRLKPTLRALKIEMAREGDAVADDSPLLLDRWLTVRDAIAGMPKPVDYWENDKFANHWGIPNARIYKGHTGSAIDWPSKVLKAGSHGVCGGEAMIRFHQNVRKTGNELRYFTIRESARMQSFPDEYVIPGTRTAAMRVLGNAVAVDVAQAVGDHLRRLTGV